MTDEELIARLRDVYVDNTIRLTAADRIKELEAKLAAASNTHWQVEAMHQNSLLHDAFTRTESAEAKLAQIEGELLRRVKHAEDCKKAAGSGTSQRREHYRMHALSEALGAVRKIINGEKE
jgi:hypothetical protein